MSQPLYIDSLHSPVGKLLLAARSDGTLVRISFLHDCSEADVLHELAQQGFEIENSPLEEIKGQLQDYFAGNRTQFNLPLAPQGTPFQKAVWEQLCAIPYGTCKAYGEIATALGNPGASRAVGLANNRNPIPIVIPCHRVIGGGGKLTGFGGGLEIKHQLLVLEGYYLL